jgi:hypothetical protein
LIGLGFFRPIGKSDEFLVSCAPSQPNAVVRSDFAVTFSVSAGSKRDRARRVRDAITVIATAPAFESQGIPMNRFFQCMMMLAVCIAVVGCSDSASTTKKEKMESKMEGKMGEKMENKMGEKMENKMGEKMENKMGEKMENKMGEKK